MMDADRLRRGRENAQILIDEQMDAEAKAQKAVEKAEADVKTAHAARAKARREARSEWIRWLEFQMPVLVWAEDKPTTGTDTPATLPQGATGERSNVEGDGRWGDGDE